jgi:hypothetical protein
MEVKSELGALMAVENASCVVQSVYCEGSMGHECWVSGVETWM